MTQTSRLGRWAARLAVRLLRSNRLGQKEMIEVTAALLDNIGALPVRSIITQDAQGTLFVAGKKLTAEQAISFKASLNALGDNHARKVLRDQVAWLAVEHGVHQGLNTDMIMFSKAVMWYAQEENNLIQAFSSAPDEDPE